MEQQVILAEKTRLERKPPTPAKRLTRRSAPFPTHSTRSHSPPENDQRRHAQVITLVDSFEDLETSQKYTLCLELYSLTSDSTRRLNGPRDDNRRRRLKSASKSTSAEEEEVEDHTYFVDVDGSVFEVDIADCYEAFPDLEEMSNVRDGGDRNAN